MNLCSSITRLFIDSREYPMPTFRLLNLALAAVLLFRTAAAADLLDPNSADEDALADATDAATAAMIVEGRPYDTIGALNEVLALARDEDELEGLYGKIFVPIKLNSASEADILLIPGVGKRMAHEFEEYRPYTSIEQFRREIGKYVDEEEVARLEQYVTLD